MKKFAFYLPQFHTIPENDKWWGKGFTEWTNVKKAHPLFKNHVQPLVPINGNYYNLLDKKTIEWQTSLMHDYRINGFIYYHYYFKGVHLLEQPAENLLRWKDIDQPFFFCWANHTWYRSWEGKKTVLVEQTYGNEQDWERHFQYLLPFFQDKRYEKKDNKPLFMLYKNFPEAESMCRYFDVRCRECGFSGISIIKTVMNNFNMRNISGLSSPFDYVLYREPTLSWGMYYKSQIIRRIVRKIKKAISHLGFAVKDLQIFEADILYKYMIKHFDYSDSKIIPCVFFSWDNTPRHGERGFIINPVHKETLYSFLDSIYSKEYLFINAWNEWAEGMIMEPTEQYRYKYLEMIRDYVPPKEK